MERLILTNLGIEMDTEDFTEEYKEKNIQFFKMLDKAVTDKSINVLWGLSNDDYYNLIAVKVDDVYNCITQPILKMYISMKNLQEKVSLERTSRFAIQAMIRNNTEVSYQYLKAKEYKSQLLLKIIKLTNGKLTKEEIEEIVTGVNPDFDNFLMVDDLQIIIISDAKEFAKKITLEDYKDNYNYSYDSWINVSLVNKELIDGRWIIDKGEFLFGEKYHDEDEEWEQVPEFNINKKHSVIIHHDYNSQRSTELIIYIPSENPYKMDKEVQYVLDNFNIA